MLLGLDTHFLFWVHISSPNPSLMYPPFPSGYISLPLTSHSCTHTTPLDTCLCLFDPTHVPTLDLWIHVFVFLTQLMYPPSSAGYLSPLQTLHSCIHLSLLDTYLRTNPFIHVSTLTFWIHISASNLLPKYRQLPFFISNTKQLYMEASWSF